MAPKEKYPTTSKFGGKPAGKPTGRPMGRNSDSYASPASDKPNSRPFNKSNGPKATFKAAPKAVADSSAGERIAKVLSRRGIASRRDAEKLIESGEVTVNGKVITSPALNVTSADLITVSGKALPEKEETRVWLYYKPEGLVTSASDEKGRETIFDHLPEDMPRVMTIGRLDLNSEGLLLLTNDGELKRRLELPSTGWLRKYRVRINGAVDDVRLQPLRDGITIEGEKFLPMQVVLDRVQGANAWVTIGLREGRNREIRRAMNAVGLYVNRLIRVSYGPFRLNDLMAGQVEEIKARVLHDQLGEAFSEASSEPKAAAPKSRAANPSARISKPTTSTGRSRSGQGLDQSSYEPGQKLLPKPREHYHNNDPREQLRKPRTEGGRSEFSRSENRGEARNEGRGEKRFESRGESRFDKRDAPRSEGRYETRGNAYGKSYGNDEPARPRRVLNASGTGNGPMRSDFARQTPEGEEPARPGRNKRFISGGTTAEAKAYVASTKPRRPRDEEEAPARRFGTAPNKFGGNKFGTNRSDDGKGFGGKTFGAKTFGSKPFAAKSGGSRDGFGPSTGGKPTGGKGRPMSGSSRPNNDGPKRTPRSRG